MDSGPPGVAFSNAWNPENTVFDAKQQIGRRFTDAAIQSDIKDITVYPTGVSCALSTYRSFDKAVWATVLGDFKLPVEVAESTCDLCFAFDNGMEADEVEVEEVQDSCNCVFSLGCGSHTLLNDTRLYIKRGGNYGLLGPDDCGTTTLARRVGLARRLAWLAPMPRIRRPRRTEDQGRGVRRLTWAPLLVVRGSVLVRPRPPLLLHAFHYRSGNPRRRLTKKNGVGG